MKLTKSVISILKNFSVINNSIYISELDVIKTLSDAGNIFGIYTMEDFEFPVKFAIWDLSEFLSIINLFDLENTDFDFKDKYVIIQNGKNKIKYNYTDPNMINNMNKLKSSEKYKKFDLFESELNIKDKDIKKIKKASSIMGLNKLKIDIDEKCIIQLVDEDGANANTFDIEIDDFIGTGNINVNVENFEIIAGDYTIKISDNKIIKLLNKDIDLFYFITANIN